MKVVSQGAEGLGFAIPFKPSRLFWKIGMHTPLIPETPMLAFVTFHLPPPPNPLKPNEKPPSSRFFLRFVLVPFPEFMGFGHTHDVRIFTGRQLICLGN